MEEQRAIISTTDETDISNSENQRRIDSSRDLSNQNISKLKSKLTYKSIKVSDPSINSSKNQKFQNFTNYGKKIFL